MRDYNRSRSDKIELQLDNKQIVSFVIGSLVVLGVVFALGVMVGKQLAAKGIGGQVAPSNPLAAIDARQKALTDASDAGASDSDEDEGEPPAQAPKGDKPLTFAQELTKPKVDPVVEPARPSTPEPKPQPKREEPAVVEPSKKEPPAQAREDSKSHGGLAAAFDKAAGKQPSEKPAGKQPSEKPAAKQPSGGGDGAFALQVASLPSRTDADKVVQQLAAKGYKGYVVAADIPGKGQYFRVRVGSYATREEANRASSGLKQKTSMSAIVTSTH